MRTLGRSRGIESHILTPEETKQMYPLLDVKDLHGSLYSPGSGEQTISLYLPKLSFSI